MSGYLPANTTLTLGDANGNIVFPGTVTSSNITTLTNNVSTNTTNIATNTTNIATNTTNIASNTLAISNINSKEVNVLTVYSSPIIYADGSPPMSVPTSSSNLYAQFGWYFKNTSTGLKVNWYMPPNQNMVVGDILGLYLRFFNCNNVSNGNVPFLTVYTIPTGSGDFYPGFFHSSMTYVLSSSVTPTNNTSYVMFENISGTCSNPSSYASNLVSMEQSTVNNPRGTYLPSQSVLAIVIGSNSTSTINSVEFIAQKLGIITASGTQELLYMPLI